MKNKKFVLASLIATLAISAPVSADWTKAASLLGGNKSETAQSGAFGAQDALVSKFLSSASLINEAQLTVAKSLKLDEVVAKHGAENQAKKGMSVEQLTEENTALGQSLAEALTKASQDGLKLDEESKKLYLEALVQYASGLVETKGVVDTAPNFISSAKDTIASASLTEKLTVTGKLEDGMYIAKEIPSYAKSIWETSQLMLSFAKSNEIEVPADATAAINTVF